MHLLKHFVAVRNGSLLILSIYTTFWIDERELNKDPDHKKILQKCLGVSPSREIQFGRIDKTTDEDYEKKAKEEMKLYRYAVDKT